MSQELRVLESFAGGSARLSTHQVRHPHSLSARSAPPRARKRQHSRCTSDPFSELDLLCSPPFAQQHVCRNHPRSDRREFCQASGLPLIQPVSQLAVCEWPSECEEPSRCSVKWKQ